MIFVAAVTKSSAPSRSIIALTSAGVMKTPRRLDSDAAQIAAATFPPAMEVNAIED